MPVVFILPVALTKCLESCQRCNNGFCGTTLDIISSFVFFTLNSLYLSLLLPVISRWGSPNPVIWPCHPSETYSLQYGEHIYSQQSQYVCLWIVWSTCHLTHYPFCCSTWAVWLLHAPWQTNWLLMWACRKTPQVCVLMSQTSWYRFVYSKSICLSQEKPVGGPSIQPPNKDPKARRSGWEMTSFLSVFLQSDTW